MLASILEKITPYLPWRVIEGRDGTAYLRRWKLLGPLWLHKFERSDADRELHNHPWPWAISLVLVNGYLEERLEFVHAPVAPQSYPWSAMIWRKDRLPGRINVIKNGTYHRVVLHQGPAWTLFLHGPRTRSWGFFNMATGEHTQFDAYLAEKGLRVSSNEFQPPLKTLW